MSNLKSPRLIDLIREWVQGDPTLKPHFYFADWKDGTYLETCCNHPNAISLKAGYALARFPVQEDPDRRVNIYYHGEDESYIKADSVVGVTIDPKKYQGAKTRGYLKPEDPQFFTKLRDYIILGHDALSCVTNCKIRWEFGETLLDREAYAQQPWWLAGPDL